MKIGRKCFVVKRKEMRLGTKKLNDIGIFYAPYYASVIWRSNHGIYPINPWSGGTETSLLIGWMC